MVAGGRAISESLKKADREKAERLRLEREAAEEHQKEKRKIESELLQKEQEIMQKYEYLLKEISPKLGIENFLGYWFGFFWLALIGIFILFDPPKKYVDSVLGCAIGVGFLFAYFWRDHKKRKKEESDEYRSLIQKRDAELKVIRKRRQELSNDFSA